MGPVCSLQLLVINMSKTDSRAMCLIQAILKLGPYNTANVVSPSLQVVFLTLQFNATLELT